MQASPNADVRAVLQNGIREIAGEVRNSLDFHRSQEGGGEVSLVVLSGSALDLPGFAEALQDQLGVQVERESVRLDEQDLGGSLCASPGDRCRPGRGGGAPMRAFNLIPADERGGAAIGTGKSGGGAFVVLGVLGVLAIFALLYGSASRQISSQRAQVATLNARAQLAQAQATRLAPYVSFMALHEQRVQAVDQLVDSRFDWAHAFHEIGRVLPKDASLSSISGTVGSSDAAPQPRPAPPQPRARRAPRLRLVPRRRAGWLEPGAASSACVTSATPPGSVPTFTLSGCATSQTEVALTLDRLRLIDGVSEVTLQSSTKADGWRWRQRWWEAGAGSCRVRDADGLRPTAERFGDKLHEHDIHRVGERLPTPATGQPTTSTGGAR